MEEQQSRFFPCPSCGIEITANTRLCPRCGLYLAPALRYNEPKSKLTAAILCWFLGDLGVHRLYLHKITSGLIMLAMAIIMLFSAYRTGWSLGWSVGWSFLTVSLMLVLGIWAIVDFITIVCGRMKDGYGDSLE